MFVFFFHDKVCPFKKKSKARNMAKEKVFRKDVIYTLGPKAQYFLPCRIRNI